MEAIAHRAYDNCKIWGTTSQVPGKDAGVWAGVERVGRHGFAFCGVDGLDEGGHGVGGVVHVDTGRDCVQADCVQLVRQERGREGFSISRLNRIKLSTC